MRHAVLPTAGDQHEQQPLLFHGRYGAATVANYDYSSCNSQAVVGDLSLRYNIASDVIGYFTYARGYSAEVYNTAAFDTLYNNFQIQQFSVIPGSTRTRTG